MKLTLVRNYQERQRRSLNNNKGVSSSMGCNNFNMYVANMGEPKYKKWTPTDLNREAEISTVILRDINTPLSIADHPAGKSAIK